LSQLFDLSDRAAVVTGACGQLGPIWIGALLGAGARVAGLDLEQAAEPPRLAELRDRYGPAAFQLYRADIRDRAQLEAAYQRCAADLGVPHVLVNNAGLDQPPNTAAPQYRFEEIPAEVFERVLAVNLSGTFKVIQVFGTAMAQAGRGSIVNIGSLYASVSPDQRFYDHLPFEPPFLKPPAYGASKAGVVNLSRYLATLWGPRGVRVNALSPGGVLGGQDPEFKRKFCARVPLGRLAEERDLVGPLLFLASDASAYVTGIDLAIDGGFTAW
jgi:NAD(P)-dependent dehydrogenase (short-subunit alcohol dehydrogenase family)